MEHQKVKIILVPILNIKILTNSYSLGTEMEKDIIVNCSITLKDTSTSILYITELNNIINKYKMYISTQESGDILVCSFFEHLNIMQITTLFGNSIKLKIITNEEIHDFSQRQINETLYKDIKKYVFNKLTSIKKNFKKCFAIHSIGNVNDNNVSDTGTSNEKLFIF
ncbi:Hypothetical protein SRAE_1000047500 [Strongyloides ratti]|uniref:Uncharacterized protein n=1 Tax=Strongyloides ratti TaxID=34506 RepID=A0A090KXT8_STRRB|nr:Hypothetical protein SRAE_1000047500 [Strongyloides ratti]CEF62201.1 Hypothetical protein SRAE_1000047500 [Strongyloides ratti]